MEQVKKITVQNISTVETQSENQPGSAILGYFKDENEISYKGYKVDIISDGVTMQIAIMFMNDLWGAMSNSPGGFNPNIFEEYCRYLILYYTVVGTSLTSIASGSQINPTNFGDCSNIVQSGDIIVAALNTDNVIFYPTQPNYTLVDFLYKNNNTFYAFQCTISNKHSAKAENLYKFVKSIILNTKTTTNIIIHIIYMVPEKSFGTFSFTTDKNPKKSGEMFAKTEANKISEHSSIDETNLITEISKNWSKLIYLSKLCIYPPNQLNAHKDTFYIDPHKKEEKERNVIDVCGTLLQCDENQGFKQHHK